jgi:soluble lytic murein transglycosylase
MRIGPITFLIAIVGIIIFVGVNPTIWGPFVYPLQYKEHIKKYASEHRLDPNLVAGMIFVESRFNAGQESHAGAVGLMQLLPSTAQSVARQLGEEEPTSKEVLVEPERNIRYGTSYMRYLLNKYGEDLDISLAAYNGGETNVDRWIYEGREDIPFAETRAFVVRVKESKDMYETIYGKWYEEGQ